MQVKITPWPWYATNEHVQSQVLDEDNYVCAAEGDTPEQVYANAALIAAAPELLTALQTVEKRLTECANAFYGAGTSKALRAAFDNWKADIAPARAAIAKAMGGIALLAVCLGCSTTETRYAVEYRADAARPADGVIVAGVSGGFSSVLR